MARLNQKCLAYALFFSCLFIMNASGAEYKGGNFFTNGSFENGSNPDNVANGLYNGWPTKTWSKKFFQDNTQSTGGTKCLRFDLGTSTTDWTRVEADLYSNNSKTAITNPNSAFRVVRVTWWAKKGGSGALPQEFAGVRIIADGLATTLRSYSSNAVDYYGYADMVGSISTSWQYYTADFLVPGGATTIIPSFVVSDYPNTSPTRSATFNLYVDSVDVFDVSMRYPEWPIWSGTPANTGRTTGHANWSTTPTTSWSYDLAAWNAFITTRWSNGTNSNVTLPYNSTTSSNYWFFNKTSWGLGSPKYHLDGISTGTLTEVPDASNMKVVDILSAYAGPETIIAESGATPYVRCYRNNSGSPVQVWQQGPFNWGTTLGDGHTHGDMQSPIVAIADMNNDGQKDVIFSKHYEVIVLNGANGNILMSLNYNGNRNYGFLGVANIDSDVYPEVCVIGYFSQHVEVLDNNGSALSLKWEKDIETNIEDNTHQTRPGPWSFMDIDGDGKAEVLVNVYNDYTSNAWTAEVFDANQSSPTYKYCLSNCYIKGVTNLDNMTTRTEVCVIGTSGQMVPTYGTCSIQIGNPGSGFTNTYTVPVTARWNTRALDHLDDNINTTAEGGRDQLVTGYVTDANWKDFFVVERGTNSNNEIARCYHLNAGGTTGVNRWSVTAPATGLLSVETTKEMDGNSGNGYETLIWERSRGETTETLTTTNTGTITLNSWWRRTESFADLQTEPFMYQVGQPVVADLDSDGKPEVIVPNGNDEIVCIENNPANSTRSVKWRMKGQPMNAAWNSSKPDGVLIADLDQDGDKEVVFAQETTTGCASLVAVNPNGSIYWRHVFSTVYDGSIPIYNLPGVTYWLADNFGSTSRKDIFVSIRRSKQHSDSGFMLNGTTGAEIWSKEHVTITDGGLGDVECAGARFASADMNGDGLADFVSCYPVDWYVLKGTDGSLLIGKNTANSYFGADKWVAYGEPILGNVKTGTSSPEILWTKSYLIGCMDYNATLYWTVDWGNAPTPVRPTLCDSVSAGTMAELIGLHYTSGGALECRFFDCVSGSNWDAYTPSRSSLFPISDMLSGDLLNAGRDTCLMAWYAPGTISCIDHYGSGSAKEKWNLGLPAPATGGIALGDTDHDTNLNLVLTTYDYNLRIYK